MNEESTGFGRTIQSVEGALEVVEALRDGERMGVTELADELGRSKSSVHHYLTTLAKHGYVESTDGRYRLSLKLLTLGGQVREHEQLYHLGKDDVDELADQTGEQASLVVERDGQAITLYQSTGDATTESVTHAGKVEDLHCTAAGKVILEGYTDAELDDFLSTATLDSYTDRTITDPAELRTAIDEVRDRGVAFDDQERYDGVRCVAAPITEGEQHVIGVVSVSGPAERLTDDRFRDTIPDQLQNVAGVLEINTTYSSWTEPRP